VLTGDYSPQEWDAVHQQLLVKEKELTSYLDMTALGRQEQWEDSPEGYPQTPPYEWWNWHDECSDAEPSRG
jgi:predicted dithiol-disulfide oxidoreductase (DUF899 family)